MLFVAALLGEPNYIISVIAPEKPPEFEKGEIVNLSPDNHLLRFEVGLHQRGYHRVAGVDEAGRGALAGPVVAAAVVLAEGTQIPDLTDSKKLSPSTRNRLFDQIQTSALTVGIGQASHLEIDRLNILQATMLAMQRAVVATNPAPDYALIDGDCLPEISMPGESIIKGDTLCHSISAASVVAKVFRDRLMCELDSRFPNYGFRQHKGYGTQKHRQAIATFGVSSCHRQTFKLE